MSRAALARVVCKTGLRPDIVKRLAKTIGIDINHTNTPVYPMKIVGLSGIEVCRFKCEIPTITHKHLCRLISINVKFPKDVYGYTLYTIDLDGESTPIIVNSLGIFCDKPMKTCTIKFKFSGNIDLRIIREIMIIYVDDVYTLMDLSKTYYINEREFASMPHSNYLNEEFNMSLIEELFDSEIELIARSSLNTSEVISRDVQNKLGQLYQHVANRYGPNTIVNGKNLSDVFKYVQKKIYCRYSLIYSPILTIYTVKNLDNIRCQDQSSIDEITSLPNIGPISYPLVVRITTHLRSLF